MQRIGDLRVIVMLLLVMTLALATGVMAQQAPADETLGLAPSMAGPASGGPAVPAGESKGVLDDFNRADGPIGAGWTVRNGYCNIVSNAAVCGGPGRATFNGAPGTGDEAELDIAAIGTDLQYGGLLLNYGAGSTNLFLKVQQQSPYAGQFTHAACYIGDGGAPFGLGFFPLTSHFTTAHMSATRVGDDVTIVFSNIDGGAQPDQTYVCTGAPPREGTGIGILGYTGIARMDNFGVPRPDCPIDSDFNGSADGWVSHSGTWYYDSQHLYTYGLEGTSSSASYAEDFADFEYEARMWRSGCDSCANRIIFRGTPDPLGSNNHWYNEYLAQYSRDGQFSLYKSVEGGSLDPIVAWTYSPAINQGDAWNTLRVEANGTSLAFSINGTLLWSGTDSSLSSGRAGVGMYASSSTGEELRVDWALLCTNGLPFSDGFESGDTSAWSSMVP